MLIDAAPGFRSAIDRRIRFLQRLRDREDAGGDTDLDHAHPDPSRFDLQLAGLHLAIDERREAREVLADIAARVVTPRSPGHFLQAVIAGVCLNRVTVGLFPDAVAIVGAPETKVLFEDLGPMRAVAGILPHLMIASCAEGGWIDQDCLNVGPDTPAVYRAALDDPAIHPLALFWSQPLGNQTAQRVLRSAERGSVSALMSRDLIATRLKAYERRVYTINERLSTKQSLAGLVDLIDWGLLMVLVLAARQEGIEDAAVTQDGPAGFLMDTALSFSSPAPRDRPRTRFR